jgi:hypothetical protein
MQGDDQGSMQGDLGGDQGDELDGEQACSEQHAEGATFKEFIFGSARSFLHYNGLVMFKFVSYS